MSLKTKTLTKKVTQSDLRRLMNAQKRKAVDLGKRVESPLAKYSDSGQLSCIVCETIIASEAVWAVHINSKNHRENIVKRKQPNILPVEPDKFSFKRPLDVESIQPHKKLKSILKNPLPVIQAPEPEIVPVTNNVENNTDEPMETEEPEPEPVSTTIPEGFFDNPVLDAKARHVEYKDPIQDEWDKFQREINEQTHVSHKIIHDESEDSTAQRQIQEIDEQLEKLSKVVELERKKDKVKAEIIPKIEIKEEQASDDEVDNFEIEFDWRAKRFLC